METLQEISRDGRAFYIHMMIFNFFSRMKTELYETILFRAVDHKSFR